MGKLKVSDIIAITLFFAALLLLILGWTGHLTPSK